jgi:hypothetical protein
MLCRKRNKAIARVEALDRVIAPAPIAIAPVGVVITAHVSTGVSLPVPPVAPAPNPRLVVPDRLRDALLSQVERLVPAPRITPRLVDPGFGDPSPEPNHPGVDDLRVRDAGVFPAVVPILPY